MAKNILVISCDIAETRVALIENGIIAELHIERRGATPRGGTTGDIYLGRVTRVLPGLQAAFVDIGLERAAFLHVEDLIRPDDFEAYLAGGRKHALGTGEGAQGVAPEEAVAAEAAEAAVAAVEAAAAAAVAEGAEESVAAEAAAEAEEAAEGGAEEEQSTAGLETDGDDSVKRRRRGSRVGPPRPKARPRGRAAERAGRRRRRNRDEARRATTTGVRRRRAERGARRPREASTIPTASPRPPRPPKTWKTCSTTRTFPASPSATRARPHRCHVRRRRSSTSDATAGAATEWRRRGRGRGRGRGRTAGARGGRAAVAAAVAGGGGGGGGGEHGNRDHRPRTGGVPGRLSKSTPIRDVVKEGQEIIVQITKEPIGTKGARCSSHVSLPGRYVVYLPTLEHVGVSKRIGSDKERARLRETIESMKPPAGGLIVRTVAEGLTKKQLKQDVGYLVRLWGEVAKKHEGAKAPATLLSELDIVLKTARDLFTDDVDQIVIDDRAQYDRTCRFVEMFMPERLKDVLYYNDDEPIFDAYGIEDEIARALSRKVPLPSGGYLILDEAEALTAVDVNTGRFVGKGSKDMEETILKTNLEAVHEIAYQLRFRNIGGLIILDLIDMEKAANREKVRKTLDELLQRDKAKTTLNRISELGLIEMTRKRTRESLGRLLHEPCFYCDGTGHLQSKETVCFDILREIRRKRQDLPGYSILVNCHPAVADLLTGSEKAAVQDAESKFMRRIQVNSRTEYHLEQFDISGH